MKKKPLAGASDFVGEPRSFRKSVKKRQQNAHYYMIKFQKKCIKRLINAHYYRKMFQKKCKTVHKIGRAQFVSNFHPGVTKISREPG